jgi:hypothetical protein
LLFLKRQTMGPPRATRRSFLSLAILASSVAGAAEYYNQPYALVSVDHHSNVDLEVDTGLRENVTGYQALLQDIFGILTPTSDTQFRPRILARQYDGRPDLSRVNEYVDGKTLIQSQRSSLELYAGASRQDSYSAETLNPQFDDFNPKAPVTAHQCRFPTALYVRTLRSHRHWSKCGIRYGQLQVSAARKRGFI